MGPGTERYAAAGAEAGGRVSVEQDDSNHPDYCVKCGIVHRDSAVPGAALSRGESPSPAGGGVKRLVVAPHCDDETLGCGGLLRKYAAESAVIVCAEPEDVRYKEFQEAQEVLGYAESFFLGLPDGQLAADMHRLVGLLDRAVARFEPHELYLPFPASHQDHIAVYEAGVRAGRLSMSEGHWFTPSVFVYDVAAYDLQLYPSHLQWNVFEDLAEHHIDAKVAALECYASQAVTGPHPVNSVKAQAGTIGHARKLEWAEPFAAVRTVRR